MPGPLPRDLNQTIIAFDASDTLFAAFRSWPLVRTYSASGKLLSESNYKIPSTLMTAAELSRYSLDFIARNPNASFSLPLLAHSITVDRAGDCYVLLNAHGVVKLGRRGQGVKQTTLKAGEKGDTFIRLVCNPATGSLYLLDIRHGNIQKLTRI